jgi:short-subunit dehydrogenase
VGLNDWSEALRRELLPDVRVTVAQPGAVDTELTVLIRPSKQPL